MTKRIFNSICTVALVVFCASLFLIMGILYDYFSTIQRNQLKSQTALTSQGVTNEGSNYFDNLKIEPCRITWIAADGSVLYDSITNEADMENHLSREEIQLALKNGYGESTRFSSTIMQRSLYSAKKLSNGTIIRLSIAQSTSFMLLLGMLYPICIIFIIAIILSLVLASRLAKKIVKPLNELNLDNPLSNKDYDELTPLLRKLDLQQHELMRQEVKLKRKTNEFDTVTGNMNEGFILINENATILSINPAAKKLLAIDMACIGQNILTINHSAVLHELLHKALDGESTQSILHLFDGAYQVNVNPVYSENHISGAVILMFNVTEKENAEKMRREFTANVSHELKTPLHSISGYAELMQKGLVKSEDINQFTGKIYSETQRMIRLVDDIIRLSRLDEGVSPALREAVNLYSISTEVVRSLEPAASLAGVSLTLSGDSSEIKGFSQHIRSIIYNLCDNAIKYNRADGEVNIRVSSDASFATVTVQDTGIGIPPEHHSRIFERFYSVDRSHSKEIGGTGLGLSIVKHAAKLHNAQIELSSVVNQGTTISIRFPKE